MRSRYFITVWGYSSRKSISKYENGVVYCGEKQYELAKAIKDNSSWLLDIEEILKSRLYTVKKACIYNNVVVGIEYNFE